MVVTPHGPKRLSKTSEAIPQICQGVKKYEKTTFWGHLFMSDFYTIPTPYLARIHQWVGNRLCACVCVCVCVCLCV